VAKAHHLAGLADIAELLGELQQPDFRADDLLVGRHDVLQRAEADQDTAVRLRLANTRNRLLTSDKGVLSDVSSPQADERTGGIKTRPRNSSVQTFQQSVPSSLGDPS
jgi:hypothetical protein